MNWDIPRLSWLTAKMKKQSGQQHKGRSGHLYEHKTALREDAEKFPKEIGGISENSSIPTNVGRDDS